ncbi:MAG: hypothetical protein KAI79_05725 [Bacteroidales bacterium]|nr:hypothetical protein [Bacteroidales bacterium]
MKIEKLNFVSYVKLLKMLILASEITDIEQTKQQYKDITESISVLANFIPEGYKDEFGNLNSLISKFLEDYGNSQIKNKLISNMDLIIAKVA